MKTRSTCRTFSSLTGNGPCGAKAQRTVLCIQDGSDLDYTSLAQCAGLGVIGTNQTSAQSRGLHLHTTLAVAPNGLPLGVLRAQCVAPKLKSPEDKRPSWAIPIEEKGYLGRKSDPEPGHQLMWQGYQQLQLMCEGFALRDSKEPEDA